MFSWLQFSQKLKLTWLHGTSRQGKKKHFSSRRQVSNTSTMPTKNSFVKKKTPEKCPFNNRGFCKEKQDCNNRHSENVCDDFECDEVKCNLDPGANCTRKIMHLLVCFSNDEQFQALNQKMKRN